MLKPLGKLNNIYLSALALSITAKGTLLLEAVLDRVSLRLEILCPHPELISHLWPDRDPEKVLASLGHFSEILGIHGRPYLPPPGL